MTYLLLENNNVNPKDPISAGGHWEKTLFGNEMMTASGSENSILSSITLGLLEDSGWYKVDYNMAGNLVWGKGQGCAFLDLSNGHNFKEFCPSHNIENLSCE
jgi:hypothetical protein